MSRTVKKSLIMLLTLALVICTGCASPLTHASYEPEESYEVDGRQGVCYEGGSYWVSGSTTLTKYDADMKKVAENTEPFEGYETEVNHIGDIDIYMGEIYAGTEYFMDGEGRSIQISIYDADTLKLKRTFPFEPESGQKECSGIAVDPEHRTVWMCSWVGGESGKYLYRYDLMTGEYLGKVRLDGPPKWLQGIACCKGSIYMTADDGDADKDEPDHLYRAEVSRKAESADVVLEKTFDDVTRQGEIEGLSFDRKNDKLLLLYNRGAKIKLGMPVGFYPGYDREISEVFSYHIDKEWK